MPDNRTSQTGLSLRTHTAHAVWNTDGSSWRPPPLLGLTSHASLQSPSWSTTHRLGGLCVLRGKELGNRTFLRGWSSPEWAIPYTADSSVATLPATPCKMERENAFIITHRLGGRCALRGKVLGKRTFLMGFSSSAWAKPYTADSNVAKFIVSPCKRKQMAATACCLNPLSILWTTYHMLQASKFHVTG